MVYDTINAEPDHWSQRRATPRVCREAEGWLESSARRGSVPSFGEGHAHLWMKAFGTTDQGGWVLGFVMLVWCLVFKHIEEMVVRHYNGTRPNWRATS